MQCVFTPVLAKSNLMFLMKNSFFFPCIIHGISMLLNSNQMWAAVHFLIICCDLKEGKNFSLGQTLQHEKATCWLLGVS